MIRISPACGWQIKLEEQMPCTHQGVVSLTFRKLSKIFSWNLCTAEIVVLVRISSWNFVRVPKAMLWAHIQSLSSKFSPQMWFPVLCIFARLFWRDHEMLVKQHPGPKPCIIMELNQLVNIASNTKSPHIYIYIYIYTHSILIYIALWTILSCNTDDNIPPSRPCHQDRHHYDWATGPEMCQPHTPAQYATPHHTQE